jgi:membrane dipeptidase
MGINQKWDIEKLHRESIIFDGLLMWGNLDSRKTMQEMIEGNLGGGNYTVANHSHDFKGAITNILKYQQVIKENRDFLAQALTAEDIQRAQKNGRVGIVFGFQDTRAIEEVDQLEVFHALGVRIVQLT